MPSDMLQTGNSPPAAPAVQQPVAAQNSTPAVLQPNLPFGMVPGDMMPSDMLQTGNSPPAAPAVQQPVAAQNSTPAVPQPNLPFGIVPGNFTGRAVDPTTAATMAYINSMTPEQLNEFNYMSGERANKNADGSFSSYNVADGGRDSGFFGVLDDLAPILTMAGAGAVLGPEIFGMFGTGAGAATGATTGAQTAGLVASQALPVAAGELPAIISTASTLPALTGSALAGAGAGGVAGGLYDTGSLQASINPPDPINTGSAPKPNYNSDLSQYTPSNMTSRYLMANGWNPTAADIAGSSVQGGLVSTARGQDPLMGMLYGGAGGAIGAGINATGLPAYVSNALNGGAWGNAAGSAVRGTLQGGLMGGIFNNGNFGQGALHGLEGSVAGSAGRAVNNALDGGWLGNTVGGAVGGGLNSIFRGTPIGQGVGLGVLSNDLGYGLHQAAPYLRGLVPNRVANAFNG